MTKQVFLKKKLGVFDETASILKKFINFFRCVLSEKKHLKKVNFLEM